MSARGRGLCLGFTSKSLRFRFANGLFILYFFILLTVCLFFLDVASAVEAFLVRRGFAVLARTFRCVLGVSPSGTFSSGVTKAASFPAALPIVIAVLIRTPSVFFGATFFLAITHYFIRFAFQASTSGAAV